MAVQITVITDTSVLINFLVIDQVALLVAMAGRRIVVTDHVRNEVTQHYPTQLARLEQALQAGLLDEISVTDLAEVALFAQLTATGLGVGECSAIAVAANRGCELAIDDKTARKRVEKLYPAINILTTELIVIELIRQGVLDVAAADAIKLDWEQNHRFRLPFGSFAERLGP